MYICMHAPPPSPSLSFQTSLANIIRRNGGAASLFSLSVLYRTMYL